MDPLWSLPRLCGYSVSLSKYYDPDLQNLAEEACLKTMGYPESRIRDPFPLRKLPNELQLEILRHTSLKTPSHIWYEHHKPGSKYYADHSVSPQCIYMPDVLERDGCVMCCADKQQHSAANPTCSCWILSIAPLMVDHKMRKMGQAILYGENTWVLDLAFCSQPCDHPQLLSLLKYARNLQIRVSTMDVGALSWDYCAADERWCDFIEALECENLQPQQLSLSFIMLHPFHDEFDRTSISATIQEGDEWRGHRSFVQCAQSIFFVSDWRPKDVFVRIIRRHHVWGDGPSWWRAITEEGSPLCDQRDFTLQEQEIERMIMNDDTYCSDTRGKSKAIHEPCGGLPGYDSNPQNPGETQDMDWPDWDIDSWEPSSCECPYRCSLCGPSNGISCYKRLP